MACTCPDKTKCGCPKTVRVHFVDKAYFTDEKIGKKMALTPEGFLLCEGVPIARTGEQLYGPDETPLKVGKDGLVHVQREEDEVFRPETMASFEGKDVVDEHPEEGVSPENWRELSVGHVQNVRRGTGVEDDYLLADFLIKDPDAIEAVRAGKREVSCGYDCDYEQTGDGRGRQHNIIGNHVALVERGRCGPRCSIKDHDHTHLKETANMAKTVTMRDRVMQFLGVKDAGELEAALNQPADDLPAAAEGGEGGVTVHNHIHMPGEAAGATEGDDDPLPLAAEGEGAEVDAEELPGYFLEHVAQNNARFDRIEQLLTAMRGGEGEGEGSEEGVDGEPDENIIEDDGEMAEEMDAAHAEGAEETESEATGDDEGDEPGEGDDAEAEMEEPAPKTGDRAHRGKGKVVRVKAKDGKRVLVKDSAPLADSYQETAALAEILVPGIKLFTFDAKAPANKTFDAICGLRRRALDAANKDDETRSLIESVNGRALKLKGMSCGAVRVLFRAVGNMRKNANDGFSVSTAMRGAGGGLGVEDTRTIKTAADLNKLNAQRYGAMQ